MKLIVRYSNGSVKKKREKVWKRHSEERIKDVTWSMRRGAMPHAS
jgi:hypothetical protein